MTRHWTRAALIVALSAVAPTGVHGDDVSITPISAARDVALIVSVLDGDESESVGGPIDSDEVGTFDESIEHSVVLPSAVAEGVVTQTSDIGPSGVEATATLATAVNSAFDGAAGAIASTEFRAVFSVAGPTDYSLQGSLSAADEATCAFQFFGGDINHSFSVTADTLPLNLSGTLAPGSYVLFAMIEGNVNIELPEVGEQRAAGSFSFEFLPCDVTPVEGRSWGAVKDVFRMDEHRDHAGE